MPLLFSIVVIFWIDILNLFDNFFRILSKDLVNIIGSKNTIAAKQFNDTIYQYLDAYNDKSTIEKFTAALANGRVIDVISVSILSALAEIGKFIEKFSLFAFWAFAQITLLILKITGVFALGLTFTGKFESFKNWIKSFLSVSLWLPFAYLVFYIIDQLYIAWANLSYMPSQYSNVGQILLLIFSFIFFAILKLILMFKVPNLIAMVIGSGGSSGGIFASALAPILISSKMLSSGAGKFTGKLK